MNRKSLSVLGVIAVLAATPVFAGPWHGSVGDSYFDYARVTDVDPVMRHVRVATPRDECWQQDVQVPVQPRYRSATPVIVGGIIGGVVGSTMGKGRGRDVATIAGTLLGGSIARDVSHGQPPAPAYTTATQTRCRTVNEYREERRIVGYRVTYRYHGHRYVTRMDHDPGARLRLRVTAVPAP
ncbi:MAG: glycine zipper 2TM domain-containing protein [Gammaproteobacteria bacterium]